MSQRGLGPAEAGLYTLPVVLVSGVAGSGGLRRVLLPREDGLAQQEAAAVLRYQQSCPSWKSPNKVVSWLKGWILIMYLQSYNHAYVHKDKSKIKQGKFSAKCCV